MIHLQPYIYDTSTEAIQDLCSRGFTIDFISDVKIRSGQTSFIGFSLSPMEYEIVETYRFDGITDPADESIVYAISSKFGRGNGFVMNAFGMYSDTNSSVLVELLL